MIKLDNLDIQILKELTKDGRQSFRHIATKLDVAPGTVQHRIEKLEDKKIIRGYKAQIDYAKLGYGFAALIGVKAIRDKIPRIIDRMINHPNVYGAYLSAGEFDMLIAVRMRRFEDLSVFLHQEFKPDEVEKTTTFMILKTKKEAHTLLE